MILSLPAIGARVESDRKLVYVHSIATAPWNRLNIDDASVLERGEELDPVNMPAWSDRLTGYLYRW